MLIHIETSATEHDKIEFHGVLLQIDTPSSKSPSGARGHNVNFTLPAAISALPSLINMPIGCRLGNTREEFGRITEAEIVNGEIKVRGYIHSKYLTHPVMRTLSEEKTTEMSYLLEDVCVEDIETPVWQIVNATFASLDIKNGY